MNQLGVVSFCEARCSRLGFSSKGTPKETTLLFRSPSTVGLGRLDWLVLEGKWLKHVETTGSKPPIRGKHDCLVGRFLLEIKRQKETTQTTLFFKAVYFFFEAW